MSGDTFIRNVEHSRGTVVFGSGIDALTGEVLSVGEDYLTLETPAQGPQNRSGQSMTPPMIHLIPLSSVMYFRFEGEGS